MTTDVIIAGGGIIGASLAWRLAQRGARVTVIERGRWGGEASEAAAGMLAPGGEVERAGGFAAMCIESAAEYPEFVGELEDAGSGRIDYRGCGAIELAASEDEARALALRVERQRKLGIQVELEVPGGPGVVSAHYPADAVVRPADVMACLRPACERAGVTIREGVAVDSVRLARRSVEVGTPSGRCFAETAVIAAGAWSSAISVQGAPPLPESYPVRGHLISYDLPPASAGPILRHGHTYILHRSTGETIAGTTHEEVGFDREIDQAAVADIRRRAALLMSQLAGLEPARVWNGFRPQVRGPGPVLDRWQDSPLWLAYGHYRNGILLAPLTARRLSQAILEQLSSH
jgi:glycine oxidase